MLPKRLIQDYLTFSRAERLFAVLVVAIVAGSLFLPRFFASTPAPLPLAKDQALVLAIDTLQERQEKRPPFRRADNNNSYAYERSVQSGFTKGELFAFDPNTISLDDWQRLGLNAKTSKTIRNYVSKGGRFHKAEDLQKIWGLPEGFYERVKDYVVLAQVRKEYAPFSDNKTAFVREEKKPLIINVNDADTAALITLPGIGSKLSARIVAFREKLGGFYSVEQVGETYGLPDSSFQKIKSRLQVDGNATRKINVNIATKDELKIHPYIKWNLANAIVEYRNQHGEFKSLEALKNIVLIDEASFKKISPYLSLD